MEMKEITLKNRRWLAVKSALVTLAARDLPTVAVFKISRRIKLLAPHTDAIEEAQQALLKSRANAEGQVRQTLDLASEMDKLMDTETTIMCLPPLTDKDLPVEKKDLAKNTEGLAALITDLGPLYDLPDE